MNQSESSIQQQIQAYLEEHQDFHLDLLRQMVDINSFTENPPGINALGELTAEVFAPLGFKPRFVPSVNEHYGRHLFLTREGTSDVEIGLISHLDTVFTEEEEASNDFHWRPDGERIYGPGTIDIKGGTVMIYMILATLQRVRPDLFEKVTWQVMLDASEEDDARDFGELAIEVLENKAKACLVFECGHVDQEKFLLVVARKGRAIFRLKAEGKASHAGTHHPDGANAIIQLLEVLQEIHTYTDYSLDITVCVATINGGTVTNRVPHLATAKVELRAFSRDAFDEVRAKIMGFNGHSTVTNPAGDFVCKVSVEIERETAPWPKEAGTEEMFQIWEEMGKRFGLQAVRQERGGLSDANLISHIVPVMDGLGPSGANAHCSEQSGDGSKEQEYIHIPTLIPKATINILAMIKMLEGFCPADPSQT